LLRLVAAAALIVLGATACSADGGTGTPTPGTSALGASTADTTEATASTPPSDGAGGGAEPPVERFPASWRACDNSLRGSSIGYPADWFTTSMGLADVCSMFHPTSFTIPVAGEFPMVALNNTQTDASLATYQSQITDPRYFTTIRVEPTTVLGLPAVKFETTSLGEGLDEPGTRRYGYIIDRSGRAFVIWTVARSSESRYTEWKTVVDIARGSLRFL
jgi:hypothetical protein